MKILKSWLKDYIEINETNDQLEELLSLSGTLVDSKEALFDEKIIVAEVRSVEKHPNADKLHICRVFNGVDELQIVCGASNVAENQRVALAQIGARIGDINIDKAVIRGIESFGMLCSDVELGFGSNHSDIKVLDKSFVVGDPLNKYIEPDMVYDIEITPNRGDELSHLGIAREIRALSKRPIKDPEVSHDIDQGLPMLDIVISEKEKCPNYYAVQINAIKIEESPDWLKSRLLKCGVRPINNIVDITNFIMLDMGQPMHAFDADKIKRIVVRYADDGEGIVTLNGKVKTLSENMLVIADQEPIAVAGVMGGANSEVDENTKNIIIESAQFDQKSVRATSKQLALQTDASYRFERGIDPGGCLKAINKAATMIEEIASGRIASQIFQHSTPKSKTSIKINYEKINELLGTELKETHINEILLSLGFEITDGKALAPSWRNDIAIWQDLAEEVARIYGYNKITKSPIKKTEPPRKSVYWQKEVVKDVLVENCFSEFYGYSFLNEQDLKITNLSTEDLLEIANPVSPENKYMRKSLIPGLLKAVAKNAYFDPILMFEIGNVFTKETEITHLGIIASGKDAKKYLDRVLDVLKIKTSLAEIKRDELERYKIRKPLTYTVEIDINEVLVNPDLQVKNKPLRSPQGGICYKQVSKYPPMARDIAFVLDDRINDREIAATISASSDNIFLIEKFDEFAADKFGKGNKSVAYHIYLQDINKALTLFEADDIISKVISNLDTKLKAKIRG